MVANIAVHVSIDVDVGIIVVKITSTCDNGAVVLSVVFVRRCAITVISQIYNNKSHENIAINVTINTTIKKLTQTVD